MTDDNDTATVDTTPNPLGYAIAIYSGDTEVIMRGNGRVRLGDLVVVRTRELDDETGRRDLQPALDLDSYTKDDIGALCTRLGIPPADDAKKSDLVAAAHLALDKLNAERNVNDARTI